MFLAPSSVQNVGRSKKEGLLRLEGRDYLVADGDVITIRFSI
ncbi:MAG: DUF933 domain-containing protein [candidate division NC10 bacterium]|nr:DUF933 domain-containing protein [candidate division NC10 bacterium]